jgi:hypothetical protein
MLEQNPITVGTKFCVSSRTKTNIVSEQIKTKVRTSYYYRPNKIHIAKTTYDYSENKFTSHLEQ